MSECEIYTDKMWQNYLQNRLSREELEKAQFHLHHCVYCRNRLRQMRVMVQEMQTFTEQKEKSRIGGRPLFRIVAVVALLLSVSMGGYFWVRTFSDKGSIIITTPSPVYNTIDSVKNPTDSINVKDKKDSILIVPIE